MDGDISVKMFPPLLIEVEEANLLPAERVCFQIGIEVTVNLNVGPFYDEYAWDLRESLTFFTSLVFQKCEDSNIFHAITYISEFDDACSGEMSNRWHYQRKAVLPCPILVYLSFPGSVSLGTFWTWFSPSVTWRHWTVYVNVTISRRNPRTYCLRILSVCLESLKSIYLLIYFVLFCFVSNHK